MAELLRVEQANKHYDGIRALKDASFAVAPGEAHALMGENGAGKSTLANIIAGSVKADGGRIFLDGQPPIEQWQSTTRQRLAAYSR